MRSVAYDRYLDKVRGGWFGKCIGGTAGALIENNKKLFDLNLEDVLPDVIPPNDDLDIQILWLDLLEAKGFDIDSEDMASIWLERCFYPFNEYGYFKKNFSRGIAPPLSGTFNNAFFAESMGAPIRAEIWAFISPGNSQLAAEYARKDAVLDHSGDGVYGEIFLAALEAEAFFEDNLQTLIHHGLRFLPADCGIYRAVKTMMELFEKEQDWRKARKQFLLLHGDPDASKARVNLGFIIMALLYGGSDFDMIMRVALNAGFDTDCTCATAAAVFGVMHGFARIPGHWHEKIGGDFVSAIDVRRPDNSILGLSKDTCRAAIALSKERSLGVSITEVPGDIDIRYPQKGNNRIGIAIEYCGPPAMRLHGSRELNICISNKSGKDIQGRLSLDVPADMRADGLPAGIVRIPQGWTRGFPCTVFHEENSRFLNQTNLFTIGFKETAKKTADPGAEKRFGIAGASVYRLYGPFRDFYDTEQYDECPWLKDGALEMPEGAANFADYVNIRKEYLPEPVDPERSEDMLLQAFEDRLPLDEAIGMTGPCCVYLNQKIDYPREEDVYLAAGNNDSFRLWLNGTRIAEEIESRYWMPFNHVYAVRMKKGINVLGLKLIRRSPSFAFSIGIRKAGHRESFNHNDWVSDFAALI